MSRRDPLDEALRKLALKVTQAAYDGKMGDEHNMQVETLKVAGNYFAATTRAKKGQGEDDDGNTMSAIQRRIAAAGNAREGHA